MSAYHFNPDVCLQVFHGIAEEIPSGVRYGNVIALFFVEILLGTTNILKRKLELGRDLVLYVYFNYFILHQSRPDFDFQKHQSALRRLYHSGKDLKAIYPKLNFTQELLSYIKNTIVTVTKKAIDWMWSNYDVSEKLKYLGELEKKSPNIEAWRPTTGEVNLNSITATNLLKRKMELMQQIELVREESAMITPYLKAFSEQTKEQLKEISSIEEKYITT